VEFDNLYTNILNTNWLMKVTDLYDDRFSEREKESKKALWKVLCTSFFQQYISEDACVIDIGAGFCEFINNITCREKYAIDLNENMAAYANPDVKVLRGAGLSIMHDGMFDVVFMSNFLEHMKSKDDVLHILAEAYRLLKDNGRILVLQPNIRYVYREYWDFFDHHVPLSDKSLSEALRLTGFSIELLIPRFLPYTTKSKFPQHPAIVKTYLRFPFLWKFLGKQAFVIGKKNAELT
jgi:SAM-dependent methyltransferase